MDGAREIANSIASETAAPRETKLADHVARMALDFLFPPLCVSCRARVSEPHALCAKCWQAIHFLDGPVCAQCGTPFDVDPGGETLCGACHLKPHDFTRARGDAL